MSTYEQNNPITTICMIMIGEYVFEFSGKNECLLAC